MRKNLYDFSKKIKDVAVESVNVDAGREVVEGVDGDAINAEAWYKAAKIVGVERVGVEGLDVPAGDKAVEGVGGDAIEVDVVETLHENRENDNLSASEGDEEEGDESDEGESGSDSDNEGDESESGESGSDNDDEEFVVRDDEVLVDDGEDGSDYEDEESDDEVGQIRGHGPLPEVRGISENIGPNGRPFLKLESTFGNKKQLLAALDQYAIKAGVNLHLTKSEPFRVRA